MKNIYSIGMNNENGYNHVTLSGFQPTSSHLFYNHTTSSRLCEYKTWVKEILK